MILSVEGNMGIQSGGSMNKERVVAVVATPVYFTNMFIDRDAKMFGISKSARQLM
jgi:hypothetical protein